jgi:hypothetical protein
MESCLWTWQALLLKTKRSGHLKNNRLVRRRCLRAFRFCSVLMCVCVRVSLSLSFQWSLFLGGCHDRRKGTWSFFVFPFLVSLTFSLFHHTFFFILLTSSHFLGLVRSTKTKQNKQTNHPPPPPTVTTRPTKATV